MSAFPQAVKEPFARKAIRYWKDHASEWLARMTVPEGRRVRHRFWQPGGGYDRNNRSIEALRAMIDYLHANPARRGLVARVEDWEWSSARWYAGLRPSLALGRVPRARSAKQGRASPQAKGIMTPPLAYPPYLDHLRNLAPRATRVAGSNPACSGINRRTRHSNNAPA
jgi:hypothetical protein